MKQFLVGVLLAIASATSQANLCALTGEGGYTTVYVQGSGNVAQLNADPRYASSALDSMVRSGYCRKVLLKCRIVASEGFMALFINNQRATPATSDTREAAWYAQQVSGDCNPNPGVCEIRSTNKGFSAVFIDGRQATQLSKNPMAANGDLTYLLQQHICARAPQKPLPIPARPKLPKPNGSQVKPSSKPTTPTSPVAPKVEAPPVSATVQP